MIGTVENLVNAFVQPVAVVTASSDYVAANPVAKRLMGFQASDPFARRTYIEMRCDAANCANDFVAQDQLVIKERRTLKILSIHKYSDNQYHCLMGSKSLFAQDNSDYILQIFEELTPYISPPIFEQLLDYAPYNEKLRLEKQFWVECSNQIENKNLLTKREMQCLQLLAAGLNTKQISKNLKISPRSVEKYFENMRGKLGCASTNLVVPKALRCGLLPLTALVFR